jgi:hypothetical protein
MLLQCLSVVGLSVVGLLVVGLSGLRVLLSSTTERGPGFG